MEPETLALLMFGTLLITLFLGHPLAFSLGILATVFGLIGTGGEIDLLFAMFASKTYGVMEEYVLVAVPLFIFMAQMLDASGIAEKLFKTMHIILGPIRGGLALAVILVCTIFAASAGVVGATEVAVGLLAVPALLRRGYDIPLTAGSICAGGTLGIIIPPSIMLVVYGSLAQVSVGHLFTSAMFPGLLLAGLYMTYITIRCAIKPEMGPPLPKEERIYSLTDKLKMILVSLVPPLALIVMVMGSIIAAVATPTEAAGIGCLGAFLLAIIYRKLTWGAVKDAAIATLKTNSMVMTLFLGGNAFQSIFMYLGGSDAISNILLGLEVHSYVILFIMMGCVFFLGMFIDWLGILLIVVPIFTPIALELEFHPVWFATLICVNLQMAFLTPPFGYSLFYLKGIAPSEMSIVHIYRGVVPFIALQWVGLIICILWPEFVLWLPKAIFGAEAIGG
ncbi:TRAP transporter large permease [Dethiosulfatarculus sandiegensis]|uniref:C4-dicarboxylate ABC transporter n=1 Tax=Dethiosulfatarculus sandiegensis TaxID=1429043 RepID=A0A0D2JEV8_9BACT|nr:TRAP transporter large permease subunit [Dethiosulfatarculus sandiegensis]KIX14206.1 C4-dicarboxylate ABC transporter [Dethiosulfatarculus sandiegensis]